MLRRNRMKRMKDKCFKIEMMKKVVSRQKERRNVQQMKN
jgi:hypothetical protein